MNSETKFHGRPIARGLVICPFFKNIFKKRSYLHIFAGNRNTKKEKRRESNHAATTESEFIYAIAPNVDDKRFILRK
jgi:hypothetical protein